MKHLYFVLAKEGHVGSGRYIEGARLVLAKNPAEAIEVARRLPAVKKNSRRGDIILEVKKIETACEAMKLILKHEIIKSASVMYKIRAISLSTVAKVLWTAERVLNNEIPLDKDVGV